MPRGSPPAVVFGASPGVFPPEAAKARTSRSRRGRSRSRSSLVLSDTVTRYWSRTSSFGCSATMASAASAAWARPSPVLSSARSEGTLNPEGEERPRLRDRVPQHLRFAH